MSRASARFVTIPNEFRLPQRYDGLLGWFCALPESSDALDCYLKSAIPADGQHFIASLTDSTFAGFDYSVFFWLTPSDLKRKRLQMPYLLQLLQHHQLLARLIEIIKMRIPASVADVNLAELWLIAAMLHDLGEFDAAIAVFRQGEIDCSNYVKNSDRFVIYDWLFAAVAYWHYRKIDDARRCLERARAMVDRDTRAEFDEVEHRIKQHPDIVPWINRDHLILGQPTE